MRSGGGGRESWSYQGQDRFVLDVLGELRDGFFVDSGASNGTKGSNTHLLEQRYGWRGICVEPNERMYRELVRDRRCVCVNCCLYDRNGPVDLVEAAGVYGGILEEYDDRQLASVRQMFGWSGATPPTVTKPGRTLQSILDEARAPAVIDYWSLDTEGSELAILKSFPFDRYRFRVLTVEHNHGPAREELRTFLETRGYSRARSLGIDDGYISNDESPGHWRSHAWRRI